MKKFRTTGPILTAGLVIAIAGLAWWSPAERGTSAIARKNNSATPSDVSARVRLIARLGRSGRLNEANREVHLLMQRTPAFSAREWVTEAYQGVRRADDREEYIRLLVSLGLPEHPRHQP